jgi:acyl dehydratase
MTVKNAFIPPKVGDVVTFRKTMTVAEQAMFTGISGNLGGLYVDRSKAKAEGLADMAVFELAAASLFTTCLSRMAGHGYRVGDLQTSFTRAVVVGTTVEATATLTAADDDRLTFALAAQADGAPYCTGTAVLVRVAKG